MNQLDCSGCNNKDIKKWKECSSHEPFLFFSIQTCENCNYFKKNLGKMCTIMYIPEDFRKRRYSEYQDLPDGYIFEYIFNKTQKQIFMLCLKYEGKYCIDCMLEMEGEYDDEFEGLDIKEPAI